MERIRFSGKELGKNAKNAVIPSNYTELKNPVLITETEMSRLINHMLNGETLQKWFPKSRTINVGSKYYVENWLIK